MAKLSELLESNYLSAKQLNGAEVNVRLESVKYEEVGMDKELKHVAYFAGKQAGLVLNKTNIETLMGLGLEDTDFIPEGFPLLRIFTVSTKMGPGLRVKAAPSVGEVMMAPPTPAPVAVLGTPPPPVNDDEVPF